MDHFVLRLTKHYIENGSETMVRGKKANKGFGLQHLVMKLSTLYVIERDNLKLRIS